LGEAQENLAEGHKQDIARLCRCEPLLSNQSNKVGRAAAGKAFRSRRTCTILPASP